MCAAPQREYIYCKKKTKNKDKPLTKRNSNRYEYNNIQENSRRAIVKITKSHTILIIM